MSVKTLSALVRSKSGKGYAKSLRRDGKIPGIFYIRGEEAVPLTFVAKEVAATLASKPALITLEMDNGNTREVIVRDIQRDPISTTVTHLDLMGIKRGEKITVTVPIHLEGIPVGVKTGGIVENITRELDIECLPKDIPESIIVDVSKMEIGESFHIDDLELENIRILNRGDVPILNVILPKVVVIAEVVDEEAEELEEDAEAAPEDDQAEEGAEAGESE